MIVAASVLWRAFVAQSEYSPRAMVSEGLALAESPKAAIADYYETYSQFPVDNAEARRHHRSLIRR